MWLAIWLAMFAFAIVTTWTWLVLEQRIPLSTTSSFAAWGWLAYRSESLQTFSGGVEFTTSLPFLQYFALFMTLISAVGLVLWWFGDFPPEEGPADNPEETPA